MPLSSSRTEFLHADSPTDIKYGRSGGWFVSTKKAFGLAIIVIASLVLVGLLVYYLAPNRKDKIAQPVEITSGTLSTHVPGSNDTSNTSTSLSPTTEVPSNDSTMSTPEVVLRLPRSVKPRYYTAYLQPFIGEENSNFTFKGHVVIELYCDKMDQKCESITLHSKELEIAWDEVTLIGTATWAVPKDISSNSTMSDGVSLNNTVVNNRSTLKIIAHSQDVGNDTITIQMDPAMESGVNYTLLIPFWGNLTDGLRGFYRSSYTDENGKKKWLAVTHLEPTSARRVFPCFDEPNIKAQFEIHVARNENLTAVSNMPFNISEPISDQPGWVLDRFLPTPVMSTYLVAVLVSEFENVKSNDTNPIFGVLARKSQIQKTGYALTIGPQILNYYTEYFGIHFPLPKTDMVALPDFQAGAMENWGLITYRETRLLVDNTSSPISKENVANTVAHELAHMWFGNLVTMDWWADIWLNEGFATYMAKLGVNYVEPSWQMLDQIVIRDVALGMSADSLLSTHPIVVNVNTTAQISEAFDPVSYSKGSCLIRMLNHSLTEPVFRAGLTNYLTTWQYGNANQDALWTSLTMATTNVSGLLPEGVTVKEVMDSWTRQEGFPVVSVSRDYNAGSMTLSQRRFLLGKNSSEKVLAQRWYIPISYTNKDEMRVSQTNTRVWLGVKSDQQVEGVTQPGSDSWVLINLQQTGFYRVNYDDANWRLLTDYLKTAPVESIPTATRAQLVSDALNLARAGLMNYSKALNLTLYLSRERSYVPWRAFLNDISYLDIMLKETSAYGNLLRYIENLLTPVETLLGMTAQPTDTHTQRLLRRALAGRLMDAEVPRYVDYARSLHHQWANTSTGPNPIPADFRYVVYCTAIRLGTAYDWKQMWSRFEEEDDPVDRLNMLASLTCSRNPYLITTLLERSLQNNTSIRLQDSKSVWQYLADNPVAAQVGFRFIRQHWDTIYSRFQRTEFVVKSVVTGVAKGVTTEVDLEAFLEFKEANEENFIQIARSMAIAIEKMQLRVLWRKQHEATVSNWLAQHVKSLA